MTALPASDSAANVATYAEVIECHHVQLMVPLHTEDLGAQFEFDRLAGPLLSAAPSASFLRKTQIEQGWVLLQSIVQGPNSVAQWNAHYRCEVFICVDEVL